MVTKLTVVNQFLAGKSILTSTRKIEKVYDLRNCVYTAMVQNLVSPIQHSKKGPALASMVTNASQNNNEDQQTKRESSFRRTESYPLPRLEDTLR